VKEFLTATEPRPLPFQANVLLLRLKSLHLSIQSETIVVTLYK